MRKSSRKPAKKRNKNNHNAHEQSINVRHDQVDSSKRSFLGAAVTYSAGAVIIGGIGYFAVDSVMANISEGDLTRIGNGNPSVVQIHDPQCPVCARLMRQTRIALENTNSDNLEYIVANIKTSKGAALAEQHKVPHVTLLLFDASGQHVQTINGVQKSEFLTPIFQSLAAGEIKPNS